MKNTKLLREAYLALQKCSNESIKIAMRTDSIRGSLRNEIAKIENVDIQHLQEEIESEALSNPI